MNLNVNIDWKFVLGAGFSIAAVRLIDRTSQEAIDTASEKISDGVKSSLEILAEAYKNYKIARNSD